MPPPGFPFAAGETLMQTADKIVALAQDYRPGHIVESVEIDNLGPLRGEVVLRIRRKVKPFPFMDLLPELRIKIYELLLVSHSHITLTYCTCSEWPDDPCTVHHDPMSIPPRNVMDRHQQTVPFVQILRTSQAIYAEAMPILYGGNNFRLHSDAIANELRSFLSVIGPGVDYIRSFALNILCKDQSHCEDGIEVGGMLARLPRLMGIQFTGNNYLGSGTAEGVQKAAASTEAQACGMYLAEQLKGLILQLQSNLRREDSIYHAMDVIQGPAYYRGDEDRKFVQQCMAEFRKAAGDYLGSLESG